MAGATQAEREGSLTIAVQILAPGCKVEPHAGESMSVQPTSLADRSGWTVDGFELQASATTSWPRDVAADWAGVVTLGVMDLVLRWPLSRVELKIKIDDAETPRSRDISWWQPYELVDTLLSWAGHLPHAVAYLSGDAFGRIEQLWTAAVAAPVEALDHLLGPLAQASSAASATHPFERVTTLWSGLELLHPKIGELHRISSVLGNDPKVAEAEETRSGDLCQKLLEYGAGFALDPWLHGPVKAALKPNSSSASDRVRAATVAAYAIRCKIVHGQWARTPDDHRVEAGVAERWLWQLFEREIEASLTGRRLAQIKAIEKSRFGA